MKQVKMVVIACSLIPSASSAGWQWPIETKNLYISRCASSIVQQGAPPSKARAFCSCFAGGLESDFDQENVQAAIHGNPNPNGSPIDKALYRIVSRCGSAYLK